MARARPLYGSPAIGRDPCVTAGAVAWAPPQSGAGATTEWQPGMVTLDGLARARHLVPPSYPLPSGDTLPPVRVHLPHTTTAHAGARLCVRAAAPLLVPRGAGCGGGGGNSRATSPACSALFVGPGHGWESPTLPSVHGHGGERCGWPCSSMHLPTSVLYFKLRTALHLSLRIRERGVPGEQEGKLSSRRQSNQKRGKGKKQKVAVAAPRTASHASAS